ncbi:MAG: hypothetical protein LBL99_04645, partial [Holosporaceae bacterium]|nr:hypothetical protein [Holosporaceae bacterium]
MSRIIPREWTPEIFLSLKKYSMRSFLCDARAGALVSVVAFPLFMTFAIASGASPSVGIKTCVIAGALVCLFGGAKFQIVGPTGAFAMIVADIIRDYGFEGMATALIMAGIIMILLGATKIGDLIHYIPYPITAGFTAGIGLSIIGSQLSGFLGLNLTSVPSNFINGITRCAANLDTINFYSFGLALFSLIFLETMQKYRPKAPRYFFVLVFGVVFSLVFKDVGMQTIGGKFGGVSCSIPVFSLPSVEAFSVDNLKKLFPSAFAIAFLGS